MKVFISWSGEQARELAELLNTWIPSVIQLAKPYFSPNDIAKGSRWNDEISKELEASEVGIICLTRDNLHSDWIMFEAGALSKNVEQSKVCPLLFGIEPTDVKGPLESFQMAKFNRTEMKKLCQMINDQLGQSKLSQEVVDKVFTKFWPDLDEDVKKILERSPTSKDTETLRNDREILEEILTLTRSMSFHRDPSKITAHISPKDLEELLTELETFFNHVDTHDTKTKVAMENLIVTVGYMVQSLSDFDSAYYNSYKALRILLSRLSEHRFNDFVNHLVPT